MFLLLMQFYSSLPRSSWYHAGKGTVAWNWHCICYETIGGSCAEALLGFHTFSCCERARGSPGKFKAFWWKEFFFGGGGDSNTVDTLRNFNCQALICMRLPGLGVGRVWMHGELVFGSWNCFWWADWCGGLCCLFYNLGPAESNAG